MATKGINIPMAADTDEVAKAIKKGIEIPTEDAIDSLVDLENQADKTGENLDDSFDDTSKTLKKIGDAADDAGDDIEDAMKKAQSQTKETQQANEDLAESIRRQTVPAYKQQADAADDTTTRGKRNIQELANEGKANLAETLSSFDGTTTGFLNGIQGTLGGVTAGLESVPAIAAAAAGAAGIGLIIQAVTQADEDSKEFKESVAELASEWIETGKIGETSIGFIVDKLKELSTTTDDNEDSLVDLQDVAKRSGSSYHDLAFAVAGYSKNIDGLVDKHKKLLDQYETEAGAIDTTQQKYAGQYAAALDKVVAEEEYVKILEEAKKRQDEAATSAAAYAASGNEDLERKATLVSNLNEMYDDGVENVDAFVDSETKLFDTDAYIKSMEERQQAIQDYVTNLAASGLSPEIQAYLNEIGGEQAAILIKAYVESSDSNKKRLEDIWSEAAKDNSSAYNQGMHNYIDNQVYRPTVDPNVDNSWRNRVDTRPFQVDATVIYRNRQGREVV